jgi:hypothetical protein
MMRCRVRLSAATVSLWKWKVEAVYIPKESDLECDMRKGEEGCKENKRGNGCKLCERKLAFWARGRYRST